MRPNTRDSSLNGVFFSSFALTQVNDACAWEWRRDIKSHESRDETNVPFHRRRVGSTNYNKHTHTHTRLDSKYSPFVKFLQLLLLHGLGKRTCAKLQQFIDLSHNKKHNLEIIVTQIHQLHKWLDNKDIDKAPSNDFWNRQVITDKQKTCSIKFRTRQYMGHARKQLFFGRDAYPSNTCPIRNSSEADTWLYILLKCKQQHIHALITKRHNKAMWEIHKLLISNKISRHYILMNAGTYNELPQENIVPTWLLSCTCGTQ